MKKPQLQHLPIDDLLPYARNAKLHPPEQILQIAASIKEFGFNAPVLVDGENGIIAGHGRVLAARKLGLTTVPCIVLDHLTEAQKRAYIIADNRLGDSDLAPWDWEMLQTELDSLKEENYDYTLTGFTDESLAAAVGSVCQALESDESSSSAPIKMTMAERFGIPPFSVLNAREGWWQARKQAWIALGIQSELGRGADISLPPGAQDGGGGLLIDQYRRAGGLTWTSPEISEKGLNYYRNRTQRPEGRQCPP